MFRTYYLLLQYGYNRSLAQTYIRLRVDSKDKANMLTAATKGDESNNMD